MRTCIWYSTSSMITYIVIVSSYCYLCVLILLSTTLCPRTIFFLAGGQQGARATARPRQRERRLAYCAGALAESRDLCQYLYCYMCVSIGTFALATQAN
jgi:hypothetical protein